MSKQTTLISRIIKMISGVFASFSSYFRPSASLKGRVTSEPTHDIPSVAAVAEKRFSPSPEQKLEIIYAKLDLVEKNIEDLSLLPLFSEEISNCEAELEKLPDGTQVGKDTKEKVLSKLNEIKSKLNLTEKEQAEQRERIEQAEQRESTEKAQQRELINKYAELFENADKMSISDWKYAIYDFKKSKSEAGWEKVALQIVEKRHHALVEKIKMQLSSLPQRPSEVERQEFEKVLKELERAKSERDNTQVEITKKLIKTEIEIEELNGKINKLQKQLDEFSDRKIEKRKEKLESKLKQLEKEVAEKNAALAPKEEIVKAQTEKLDLLKHVAQKEIDFKQKIREYAYLFADLERLEKGELHKEVGVPFDEKSGLKRYYDFLASIGYSPEETTHKT